MAGTIIADFIRTDANQLSLNVGNTTFATINTSGFFSNTGTQLIAANGKISGASVIANSVGTSAIADSAITRTKMGYAGAILQVVQTVKTDTFTMSGSTLTTVTGLTANITPIYATSKILVMVYMNIGQGYYNTNGRLLRNSTAIGLGDQLTSRPRMNFGINSYVANQTSEEYHMIPVTVVYLDSPATTSSTTYSIQLSNYSGYTTALNRSVNFQDAAGYDPTLISTITVMEIAQ
jgi:hypothetical protein